MRTLYLDCQMGCAGDMFSGALFDLLSDEEKVSFLDYLRSIEIPGVTFAVNKVEDCGVSGSAFRVIVNEDLQEGPGGNVLQSPSLTKTKKNKSKLKDQRKKKNAKSGSMLEEQSTISITNHAHEDHRTPDQIADLITSLGLNHAVESDALAIFSLIARAEALAHSVDISQVHFHEVGAMDAVADVISAAVLMWLVNPAVVFASAINVGSGTVMCEHGELPVPTPAVANLLRGIPIYSGNINGQIIRGELCTPTGAAILRHFVTEFAPMPKMTISATGYGFGHLRFSAPNCMRAFIGDLDAVKSENPFSDGEPAEERPSVEKERHPRSEASVPSDASNSDAIAASIDQSIPPDQAKIVNSLYIGADYVGMDADGSSWISRADHTTEMSDTIVSLSCNIDDMSPEDLGFAFEVLSDSNETLDVFMQPIQMKKSRPGTMLTVLVQPHNVDSVARKIFQMTTTIGIRKTNMSRLVLNRQVDERDTPLGKLRVKVSEGYGVKREKPEFDDVAKAFMQIQETE